MVDPRIPGLLSGDPIKLHQILLNLIGNAIKYAVSRYLISKLIFIRFTDVGEVLTVCRLVDPTKRAKSSAPLAADEVELLLEVKDTGCGIKTEHQKRLFTPFFQADARTTRKYGGTGTLILFS